MSDVQSHVNRSFSVKRLSSNSPKVKFSPEKYKEKYRSGIKALKSSKFSQVFTRPSHNDIKLHNYREFTYNSTKKKIAKSISPTEPVSPNQKSRFFNGKVALKRQKTIENFNVLIEKCKDVQKALLSSPVLKDCRSFSSNLGKLRESIEIFQVSQSEGSKVHSKTVKMLKKDAKNIREQISYSEKKKNRKPCIWKKRFAFLDRKSDRLISSVATKLKHKDQFK